MQLSFILALPQASGTVARWSVSGAAAIAVHAMLAAGLAWCWIDPPSSVSDLPAVTVDMEPPASAPPVPPADASPSLAEPDATAPLPAPDPILPSEITPEIAPDASQPLTAAMQESPQPQAVALPVAIDPPPPSPSKSVVALPSQPKKVAARQPRREVKREPAQRRPPKPVQADRRERETRQTRRPPANASGATTMASLPTLSGGNSAASKAAWQSQIVAYLQRNTHFPPGSGNGGSASVTFSLDRHGHVLSARLSRSAGRADLDAAALAAFRGTLPAAPPDVPGAVFAFTNPVRFDRPL